MDINELKGKLDGIKTLIEQAGAAGAIEPAGVSASLIGLAVFGELLLDIKRIADAAESVERDLLARPD